MSRRVKKALWIGIPVLLGLAAVAVSGVYFLLRSGWFFDKLRLAVEQELEKSTGGKAEIQSFAFDWRTMRANARGVTIHGLEPAGAAPFVSIGRVTVGLHLISLVDRKVNIALLDVEGARVNVTVDKDGRTSIPSPGARTGKSPMDRFLDLAIGDYRIRQSEFRYRSDSTPIEAAGKDLNLRLELDPEKQAYSGTISTRSTRIERLLPFPLTSDMDAKFRFDRAGFEITESKVSAGGSTLKFQGALGSLERFHLKGNSEGEIRLADLRPGMPGSVSYRAKVDYLSDREWTAVGHGKARDLAGQRDGIAVSGVTAEADWTATPDRLDLSNLRAQVLGGEFAGVARLDASGAYSAKGAIRGFDAQRLASLRQVTLPWQAVVAGDVEIDASRFAADITLSPSPEATPVQGRAVVTYTLATREIVIGSSSLDLPSSRVTANGKPGEAVEFVITTKDPNELLPALRLVSSRAPAELPLSMKPGGAIQIGGRWTGGISQPLLQGNISLDAFRYADRDIEHAEADFRLSLNKAEFHDIVAREPGIAITGEGSIALEDWRAGDDAAVTANLQLQSARVEHLLKEAKLDYPVRGTVSASMRAAGSLARPVVTGRASIAGVELGTETFDGVDAEFEFRDRVLELKQGRLREGKGLLDFWVKAGVPVNPADPAPISFRGEAAGFRLGQWRAVQERQVPLDGGLTLHVTGGAVRRNGQVNLTALDGELRVQDASVSGRRIGDAVITSKTNGRAVTANIVAQVRDSTLKGFAEWNLGGVSYGLGQLQLSRISFANLQDLGFIGAPGEPLAFSGSFDAEVGFSGPILRPETWTGVAKVASIEIEPNPRTAARSTQRFRLRNKEPLVASIDANGVKLQAVQLVAEGTDLEAVGTIAFRSKNPFNLQLKGRLNLPVLSMFEPDLIASGVSTLDAAVRGSLNRPQVTGRMEMKDATFNLRGLPNGLEKTNAAIVFDRTRANIERLTAQTGGGDLSVTGFVGFGGDELNYRLNGIAQRVRVRDPAAVSTTFNANLNLTGTSSRSLLSGAVTVNKMGITPRTDIGSLLAEAGRASNAPATAPNDFLRGMQLDVKIDTAPDAELQSSLARDLEPDASFRLYGSAVKPALLGRASLNRGEINFFGNQYSITRGDISFYNTAKVEPVLDFDLETRVRGVTVNINFTGPVNRLDVSYRSDPPLRSNEIVALLAVGRTPDASITPNLPGSAQQGFLQSTNNTLLGQAISAPISGRLERLFGVSRIKIDPELTGVTNTPQARLTVEQQLSRDVTVTYITNLNRTQQQIVRVQWDLSRDFSVLAVRDDNGVFGVDFLYRKRF